MVAFLAALSFTLGCAGCTALLVYALRTNDVSVKEVVWIGGISIGLVMLGVTGVRYVETLCQCPYNTFTKQQGTKTK